MEWTGERVSAPRVWNGRDANANCLPKLSRFKISSTKVLALECSKKLTNPMTLTEYSLLPKSTSSRLQRPINHHSRPKIRHFYGDDTDKIPLRIRDNTSFQVKIHFFWEGLAGPLPRPLSRGGVFLPYLTCRPHQALWIRPCVPQNSSQIYATVQITATGYCRPIYAAWHDAYLLTSRVIQKTSFVVKMRAKRYKCKNVIRRSLGGL